MRSFYCGPKIIAPVLASATAAMARQQSALSPAGPAAARTAVLWWIFLAICGAAFIAVIALVLYGTFRAPVGVTDAPEAAARCDRHKTRVVAGAAAAVIVILFFFMIASFSTSRSMSSLQQPNALEIDVTGHQWWWEVHYPDSAADKSVVTANEIHVPVGRPVMVRLRSADVIHSFWAPNIRGKEDLIPGRVNTAWFRVDKAGVYRGQCAEFCGFQHAHMGFYIIAQPPAQFAAWLADQCKPADAPVTPEERRGQQVFLDSPCVLCHTISGTPAFGTVGPDLSHLASRHTIAAATLVNNRGNLSAWITDPQHVKPGNQMASMSISADDLQPLLTYLESLK